MKPIKTATSYLVGRVHLLLQMKRLSLSPCLFPIPSVSSADVSPISDALGGRTVLSQFEAPTEIEFARPAIFAERGVRISKPTAAYRIDP